MNLKDAYHQNIIFVMTQPFNHQAGVIGGILQDECSFLLHTFFKDNSSKLHS